MARLVGGSITEVVSLFGDDHTIESLDGGRHRYTWRFSDQVLARGGRGPPTLGASRSGPTYKAGRRAAPRLITEVCTVHVDVDAAGTVAGWLAEGRGCGDVLRTRAP